MTRLTRRHLLLRAVPLGVAGIAFARAVRAADACVGPDTESLRASLNYANPGADAAATCAHCAFFTADPPAPPAVRARSWAVLSTAPVIATRSARRRSPDSADLPGTLARHDLRRNRRCAIAPARAQEIAERGDFRIIELLRVGGHGLPAGRADIRGLVRTEQDDVDQRGRVLALHDRAAGERRALESAAASRGAVAFAAAASHRAARRLARPRCSRPPPRSRSRAGSAGIPRSRAGLRS